MLSLIEPTARLHSSWLEACAEFDGEHQAGAGFDVMNLEAAGLAGAELEDPEAFARWTDYLRAASDPAIEPPPHLVRCSYLWMVDDGGDPVDDGGDPVHGGGATGNGDSGGAGLDGPGDGGRPAYAGAIAIRHTLTPFLLEQGGHIGYSVRPSRRRRGIARWALGRAVGLAAGLGIDRILITCDEDNIASRRTIEANRGVYEDSRGIKRRYWITPPAPRPSTQNPWIRAKPVD